MKAWSRLEVRQSAEFIPALFKGLELNVGKKNCHISAVVSECISNVVAVHVSVNNYGETICFVFMYFYLFIYQIRISIP